MIKEKDSVKIDYVGMADNKAFDTTDEKTAKDSDLINEKRQYKPVTIIIGAEHVLKGLDKSLIDKKKGDKLEINIDPEDGFGKRDPDQIKLVPMAPFKRDKVKPYVGMVLNVDGRVGMVKSVSGGRVVVDFNHPLSGKKLKYTVWVRDVIKEDSDRLKGLFEYHTGLDAEIKTNDIIFKGGMPSPVKSRAFEDAEKYLGKKKLRFIEVWK